ncbi:hypothetical protein [Arenibaculum pallidiluteum]|uniref:hypothetical protein n=1 Tax=Arenibaculum pallidiluteum TaxID=2812559 RepID=UPI001A97BE5D|nr:hypothetical protein [Arenibaculum pallidiluteum]
MLGDRDIYLRRARNAAVRDAAERRAEERVDALGQHGDRGGYDVWRRIRAAIGELRSVQPGAGTTLH